MTPVPDDHVNVTVDEVSFTPAAGAVICAMSEGVGEGPAVGVGVGVAVGAGDAVGRGVGVAVGIVAEEPVPYVA